MRRHWRLLVACCVGALVVGWWLTPSGAGEDSAAWSSTLTVVPAPGSEEAVKLDVVRTFATSEEVATDAARRLKRPSGEAVSLKSRVDVVADSTAGMLTITAQGTSQKDSETLANAYARATVEGYRKSLRDSARASAAEHDKQLRTLGKDISALQGDMDRSFGSRRTQLKSQLDALNSQYSDLYSTISALRQTAATPVLQLFGGINSTAGDESVLRAPESPVARLALAVALGLALGLVAALMLDRVDTRLRTRSQAEEAFGVPVIGEIPVTPVRLRRSGTPAVTASPASPTAEAYRSLRAALLLSAPPTLSFPVNGRGEERGTLAARRLNQPGPVVLVVSAREGDGRTTTVANLAAALAETGRSVLVLDCDFRASRVHELLGAEPGPGMAELLAGEAAGERPAEFEDMIRPTCVERVGLVTAGRTTSYPAALVVHADDVFDRARRHADVVLVDSSPLLRANDAYDLVAHADTVLLTARSGQLTPEQAGRVGELLGRTNIPVAGLALTASPGSPGGGSWTTRRPYEAPAPGALALFPGTRQAPGPPRSADGSGPRAASDTVRAARGSDPPVERPAPSWARGRESGGTPRAEGDDL